MALQPVDIAVALTAAHIASRRGGWRPAEVQRALDLPWSTLDRALGRLERAGVVRDGHLNTVAVASLLPVLRYLCPLEVDGSRTVRGTATGYASMAFDDHIRFGVAPVWADPAGAAMGHPVRPLHPGVVSVAHRDPELTTVFALVDAVRGGRAREVGFAMERLRELLGLPEPHTAA